MLFFIEEETYIQHFQNHIADKYRNDFDSRPGCSLALMETPSSIREPLLLT